MSEFYIGLMSGTSLDGIDAALIDFSELKPKFVAFDYCPYEPAFKSRLARLTSTQEPIRLEDYGTVDTQLGRQFAQSVLKLLSKANIPSQTIKAIGSHGHTIYHAPDLNSAFSLQIGDPNIIAETTGITTVADFRRRDIAAKGQGAPLVPAFHHAFFGKHQENRVVVNIGGIANITVLPGTSIDKVIGFDTGPGNGLMDQWIKHHKDLDFDANGDWASSGQLLTNVMTQLLSDDYFNHPAPKSTGKEYFSLDWLHKKVKGLADYNPNDIQCCLCHLTAQSLADAINRYAHKTDLILICGGGVHNAFLMDLLKQKSRCKVLSTEHFNLHPDHVEATAFAWLARQTMNHQPGNLKSVTGANKAVVLGAIYQG
ncbi:MAG: anhydro-N-acetylmuramic acid kinase [Methylicorpusculum sp.]|uniref:anhydro-N-acetylmuramic acid kinase n=1 Tax=Methylicorpusculum sp. TaxID=2713644 RepID=UPI002727B081|nr:anhydro-N-acetylmuramic acid kinase [Methylicorpusculum sp.]MDO8939208.1 anhydro-N-acetylmuramic acid kinase [Methylicorpusculum sp.]MDO9240086.1 anhydro-N-acetylmuramic acid kinase [Methylicorpusculum sp.]MDP2204161.1 anhydro-N-acetylmuramic acid kinase [Methylicorpusculum sp.]